MKYGIALLLITISITSSAQEEKPVPKDSVRVSIPGCSKGSAFVVTESPEGERTSVEIQTGRRFRLTGKKELLNEIKAREGYMIAVTGIVRRNDLRGPAVSRSAAAACASAADRRSQARAQTRTARRSRRMRSWTSRDSVRSENPARNERCPAKAGHYIDRSSPMRACRVADACEHAELKAKPEIGAAIHTARVPSTRSRCHGLRQAI